MNESKFTRQFQEVIAQSSKSTGNCVCLQITNESASLMGVSKKTLIPQTALVLIRHNGQTYVKGCFDGVYFETSTIEDLNASNPILIGIDCRSKDNNIIFYKSGRTIGKVSQSSPMKSTDAVYIFWEYGSNACLTICAYDPSLDAIVREIVSAGNEPIKRFLKAIVRQALPPHEEEGVDQDTPFDLEDDAEEEELDDETEWDWEDSN